MGQLERDAKKLVRDLSSDPGYGKATAWFWVGLLVLGGIVAGIGAMTRFTASDWVTFGIAAGLVIGAITLTVILARPPKRPKPTRDIF